MLCVTGEFLLAFVFAHSVEIIMTSSDELVTLLTEIRDLQREHLDEYKAFAARALESQEESLRRQAAIAALYKKVVGVAAIVIAGLVGYLVFVLGPQVQ